MPKPRKITLETSTARAKLTARKASYFVRVAPNIALGYRRNESGFGTWSVRFADGRTSWLKKFGIADDLEPADGKYVFNYDQALAQARKLARGEADAEPEAIAIGFAPVSLDDALTDYQRDLEARGASIYNASGLRRHLSSQLLGKPVALLEAKELRNWRDGLLTKGLQPSSVVRYCKSLRAALNLAASRDKRIQNAGAWEAGLESLPDATVARNVILGDRDVSRFVAAGYRVDAHLGLFVDVLAVTGARPSQAARLLVEDLHGGAKPRLTMPRSAKGGSKNRAKRKAERISVPITPALATKLKEAAKGRAADAPLLLQNNGQPWSGSDDYREDVARIVKVLNLDSRATMYALRHSSIVRALLRGLPIRLVAASHDTSSAEIERTYSKHITDHSDEIARAALLHHAPASAVANSVVGLVQ
ncbi:tyrosine-type recombinase/integrase [Bradyrhizobium sp. NBAIM20]|uniref:tyrosine-type recombinase/integrase n=1 Tax=unclassified Bradyrhizobium TaxID=2631580 RepID=UPI001CD3D1CF|nr:MULTISPECIES: tyrosine-type recombinase/integrase [unclassified Bradyrhizobium]MCA1412687.1 tyrosine-type recombinase/integrase [Bradyrhizobium sp. NBAIM20]MCA1463463.1 tyrosine-type recombinase/integrase [Bradyrhizobium sp. NBAIM18]